MTPTTSKTCRTNPPSRPAGYDALPKRFKDYINQMESELNSLQRVLDAEGETRVALESYSRSFTKRYLPDDARIVFTLERAGGRQAHVEVQIDRRRGSAGLAVSSPDGRLVVLPEVSNEFCVRVGDI